MACCKRPAVATMDYLKWSPNRLIGMDSEPRVNRCCTTCWTHWFGHPNAVKQYTRAEWNEYVAA